MDTYNSIQTPARRIEPPEPNAPVKARYQPDQREQSRTPRARRCILPATPAMSGSEVHNVHITPKKTPLQATCT